MNDNFVPYLCGGILFSFLIELHKDTAENLHGTWGTKKGLRQHEMMKMLICAIKPDYIYNGNTLEKDTSHYRACKKTGNTIIPFENASTKTEFDKSVRNQYDGVLKRMKKFTTECFPTCTDTAMRILVKRTLVLIRDDSSIKNDTLFFINQDGSPISKEDLLKKKDFCFQSFLVGIWHYIITKPTKNENGKQTFEKLFRQCNGKNWKLYTDCLKPYDLDINVTGIELYKESLSEENYKGQNIFELPKADRKEISEIKIYCKSGLLEDKEEHAILSFSPEIIDLDETPKISIKDFRYGPIYKITTEFQIETQFLSNMKEIIILNCNIGSFNIFGITSEERWISKSKLNIMLFQQKNICTAWFRLEKDSENKYRAEFYMIGKILQ